MPAAGRPPAPWHRLEAVVCAELGESDAAIEAYRRAIDLEPNVAVHFFNRGLTLMDVPDRPMSDSMNDLNRALALNPNARLIIAPAMNGKMWQHPATQQNVATLKSRGAEFLGPDAGMLSCGYEGIGRLLPVDKIAERFIQLAGKL